MSEQLIPANDPKLEEAQAVTAPILERARAVVVTTFDEHQAALRYLVDVMAAERKVKAIFAPLIEAATEAKRKAELARAEAVGLRDRAMESVTAAREAISKTCAAFEAEEKRIAKLNQERIDAEAKAKQDEDRILEAAMADTPEEAAAILEDPVAPPVTPTVKPDVAKVAGVSSRETWSAEIYDKPAFLEWAAKPENNVYADPNGPMLNSRARAEKEQLRIPGVRAVSKISHAAR